MLSKRESEIYRSIHQKTLSDMKNMEFECLGSDAQNIGLDLYLDRANVSRILNKLHRMGYLAKIVGRPSLYFSKDACYEIFPDIHCPSLFSNMKNAEELFINHIQSNEDKYDPFSQLIGNSENESIHEAVNRLKSAVLYPPNGLTCLIYGPRGAGKRIIIQSLFEYGAHKGMYKKENNLIQIFAQEVTASSLANILPNHDLQKKFIVIYDYDLLERNLKNELARLSCDGKNFYVLTSTTLNLDDGFIVPVVIEIKDYHERTIKERMEYVITIFQNESNRIQRTIHVSKNVLNCFIMARYKDNILELEKEIKVSIAYEMFKGKHPIIEITFDSMSDELLRSIQPVNNYLEQLNSIYAIINVNKIAFIPKEKNACLETIKKHLVYIDDNILVDKRIKNKQLESNHSMYIQAKNMIKFALNSSLTSINTSMVSELYQLLYSCIQTHPISQNDQLLYGLLYQLDRYIHHKQDDNYLQYSNTSARGFIAYETINKIVKVIKRDFKIDLGTDEKTFIDIYLDMVSKIVEKSFIQVIFVSSSLNNAKNYAQFSDTLTSNKKSLYWDYMMLNQYVKNPKEIEKIDSGKGILLFSDEQLDESIKLVFKEHSHAVMFIDDFNIHDLSKVIPMLDKEDTFIEDFSALYSNKNRIKSEDEKMDIVHLMKNDILEVSLTFLNPNKVLRLGEESLNTILDELDIAYTDILFFKFIAHVAFMVERVIRNEAANYKKLSQYVKKHGVTLHILEKAMVNIENEFGIKIPQSELVYIAEIFLSAQE